MPDAQSQAAVFQANERIRALLEGLPPYPTLWTDAQSAEYERLVREYNALRRATGPQLETAAA